MTKRSHFVVLDFKRSAGESIFRRLPAPDGGEFVALNKEVYDRALNKAGKKLREVIENNSKKHNPSPK